MFLTLKKAGDIVLQHSNRMGTNVCVVLLILMALVAVVYCTDRPKRGCDHRCLLKSLTSGAGKRKKSVDLDQDGYLWNQKDTSPTYTADAVTKGQRSYSFDEVLGNLSPKWQDRLLAVLEGAVMDREPIDDDNFGH